MSSRIDFLLISRDRAVAKRCAEVCSDFKYSFKLLSAVSDIPQDVNLSVPGGLGSNALNQPGIVMVSLPSPISHEEAISKITEVRARCTGAFIIAVVERAMADLTIRAVKQAGAGLVYLEREVFDTSKIEFICTQVIKAGHLPIKPDELIVGQKMTFTAYVLLPLAKKFLPYAHKGLVLTQKKIEKLNGINELYIRKEDATIFREYCQANNNGSDLSLSRRCRAHFLDLYAHYVKLVHLLTDQSEYSSFSDGQELLAQCFRIAAALSGTLKQFGSAWDVINASTIGEFGSVERSPAVAAYAALFAGNSDVENVDQIMVATLLSDLSLVLMPPSITKKIREDRLQDLSVDEMRLYYSHPLMSLNAALERKLPIDEKMRSIILSTHEFHDGTGFPKRLYGDKVPMGAQMIQVSEALDKMTCAKLGRQRVNHDVVRHQIIKNYMAGTKFSAELMKMLLAS